MSSRVHGVHIMLESLIEIEAEAVNFVERAVITESVVALIGDSPVGRSISFSHAVTLQR
jgi:hypothetical protein